MPNLSVIDSRHAANSPLAQVQGGRAVASEILLSAKGLCKKFNDSNQQVFSGINIAVQPGERLALIGANGAGKSTLLRCLHRLIEPDAGSVWFQGEEFTKLKGHRLRRQRARIGFVFQHHNLVSQLSVLTNVIHGMLGRRASMRGWLQGLAPRLEREFAYHCLEQVGMADYARRSVKNLSGGQSQKVAIARSLMQRPVALFADEAAASLDPLAGEEIMQLFAELSDENGMALLFVSHDLDHAIRYSQRLIALQGGCIALDRVSNECSQEMLRGVYE